MWNQRLYDKKRYEERRTQGLILLGEVCSVCGSTDELEFDHINPITKLFNISDGYNYTYERWLREIEKCQLLCKPHHIEKTANYELFSHGSISSYKRGCRCDSCRKSKSDYRKDLKSRGGVWK